MAHFLQIPEKICLHWNLPRWVDRSAIIVRRKCGLRRMSFYVVQICRMWLVTNDLKPMIFWRLITIRMRLLASPAFLTPRQ
jgi:hypothetical protein